MSKKAATTRAQSGRCPLSPAIATGTRTAARSKSAVTINRLREARSATTPPWKPNRSAGTLSASRTAITPSGPPAMRAAHISAMYWNASPSSLVTTARYSRRNCGRRSNASAPGEGGAAGALISSGSAVIGSAIGLT